MLYQTSAMKMAFDAFPDVLCCDATYKLTNIGMPMYCLAVVGGDGQTSVLMSEVYQLQLSAAQETISKNIEKSKY